MWAFSQIGQEPGGMQPCPFSSPPCHPSAAGTLDSSSRTHLLEPPGRLLPFCLEASFPPGKSQALGTEPRVLAALPFPALLPPLHTHAHTHTCAHAFCLTLGQAQSWAAARRFLKPTLTFGTGQWAMLRSCFGGHSFCWRRLWRRSSGQVGGDFSSSSWWLGPTQCPGLPCNLLWADHNSSKPRFLHL